MPPGAWVTYAATSPRDGPERKHRTGITTSSASRKRDVLEARSISVQPQDGAGKEMVRCGEAVWWGDRTPKWGSEAASGSKTEQKHRQVPGDFLGRIPSFAARVLR